MKSWVSSSFILSLLLPVSAQASDLKYEDIPELIRKNNKAVQASQESVEIAKLRSGSLDRSFLPKVGFEAGVRGQEEADGTGESAPFWKVEIQSNIYRGGRDKYRVSALERQHELKSFDAQALFRNELYKARREYILLLANHEQLALTRSVREQRLKRKRSIQRKVQAGILTETSTALVGIFEADIDREIMLLEKDQHEIEDRLVLALGLDVGTELKLNKAISIPVTKTETADFAELRKMKLQSELLRSESTLKSEWWRPDIDVFGSYVRTVVGEKAEPGPLPARESAIGLRFTLTLQDSADLRAETSAKIREASYWDLQREQTKREMDYRVHEYEHEIATLTAFLEKLEAQSKATERFQRQIDIEFERGIRDSSDIMDAVRSIYELKRKQLETLTDIRLAKAGLQTMLEQAP